MPKILWRHNADNLVAPLCRKRIGAFTVKVHNGQVFVFRGRRGDRIKVLWWDGHGLCLFCKRLERGHFVWPQTQTGGVYLSAAQLSMLLEGIDWRHTVRTGPSLAA